MKCNSAGEYDVYTFTKKEYIRYLIFGIMYYFVLGMIFYQSLMLSLIASSGVVFYLKAKKKECRRIRKNNLLLQFREGMYAMSSSLGAGRSMEQAMVQSLDDLKVIYTDCDDIVVEWQKMVDGLYMNETIEEVFISFSERAGMEDIHNFCSILIMAKRSGGDMLQVIKEAVTIINDRIEIKKEIDVMITQKKYEQKILSYIIPGMILLFTFTSPHFLEPMYTTYIGRIVMTAAFFMYLLSGVLGKQIALIEV